MNRRSFCFVLSRPLYSVGSAASSVRSLCDRGVRFQSVCRPRLVRVLRNLPPPISAHLGLSMSDRSPPVARPSEARRPSMWCPSEARIL